jgi:flavin reductase (DIM6/NTAB) family NADH-FMN oxidoreductase RutF/DNA-binding IclR family transcriptional regulator
MSASFRFDTRELRQVLGAFVTGVTVVTTVDDRGKFHGLTANSFSSVSLEPPLVLWSQAITGPSHPVFSAAPRFAVNILAEDQIALSNRFASSGSDKFAGLDVEVGRGGIPLLPNCSAWLECEVISKLPGGDHTIYIGRVDAIRRTSRKPLIFAGGQYMVADPHDLVPPNPARVQSQLHAVRLGARAMSRLSAEFDESMALAVWGNHGPTVTTWEPASTPVSDSLPVGLILPVTSTATGLAFAAHLPAAVTRDFVDAELEGPGQTPPAWTAKLAEVRRHGLARHVSGTFHGGGPTINTLSAPVLDSTGTAVLAMTAVGRATTFNAEFETTFAAALRAAAEDLSRRLGYGLHTAGSSAKALAMAGS